MNFRKITCFDLEMTCWNDGRERRTGEIIEVGVASIQLPGTENPKGCVLERSQYYVLPEKDEISDYCTELTGITQARLNKSGRPLADVLESMKTKYGHHSIYGAWGRDNLVIQKECAEKGISVPFYEFLNLKTLFMINNRIRNKRFGMLKAMEMSGLEFEGDPHSGYSDSYNLARLTLTFI